MRRIRRASAVFVLMLSSVAHGEAPRSVTLDPGAINVVDGDTIRVDPGYRLGPDQWLGHGRIRLVAIDAPELFHSRCDNERAQARAAADRLRELLQQAAIARIILTGERDKYRRPLARLLLGGTDVADELMRAGLALPWRPGRPAWLQRGRHWCPARQPPPETNP